MSDRPEMRPGIGDDVDLGALLRQLAAQVRDLVAKGSSYASLGVKRMKLRAVDGAFSAVWGVVGLLAAGTIVIYGAVLLLSGLRLAIARWSGAEWIGELAAGAFALSAIFITLFVVQRRTRRRLLERALYGPPKPKNDAVGATPAASVPAASAAAKEPS